MIIGKKKFTWDISGTQQASLQQQKNGMYIGEVRNKTDNTIIFVQTCRTCAEFYRSLQSRVDVA